MPLPTPVRLYDQPMAPNPRRVNLFIAEKGLEIAREEVNLIKLEHRAEAYAGRAGASQLPALELSDGTVLAETQPICRYLEALHPEPNMMGDGPLETARIEMWQRLVEFGLFAAVGSAFRHTNRHMAVLEDQCADWGAVNLGRIDLRLAELDRRLEGREWIVAGRLTVADITALVAVDYLRVLRRSVPEEFGNVRAWHARWRERPSSRTGLREKSS
ncbi:MAG TPA: glutathione S-transferase family protein [Thermohalobaculum sp.]|nr:glutathione S-transferase family protein [Thermohalobaculum sp.]